MIPKVALLGAGRFGRNHLRVLTRLESEKKCELVGVVDTNIEVLERTAKDYNVNTSTTPDDFVNDIDAIDIVTPTNTHFNLCKKFLCAGKHVLVEKPLTTNFFEAKELFRLAIEQKKILMVGHIFRYNPVVQKIKELIEKSELGQIYYLSGHFTGLKDPRLDGGALYTYTVHHIDIYNYFLEKLPEDVTCRTGHFLGRKEFEDVAILTLKYPSGTLGIVEGSWLSPGKNRDLTVVGSKKSVTSDLLKQTLRIYNSHIEKRGEHFKAVDQGSKKMKLEFKEPLELELLDFVNSVETGQKPLSDGKAALNSIKVMEKALESAKLDKNVRVSW